LQYPDNVRIVRVPCTGKVDAQYVLSAFENGADGVMVIGCLEGECHYLTGNLRARKRVTRVKEFLQQANIEPERTDMFNLSSGEAPKFAQVVSEFTERIAGMGPLFVDKDCGDQTPAPAEVET